MNNDFSERLKKAQTVFQGAVDEHERLQEEFWESLTAEQQLDAFCAVVRRIHRGDVELQGSYRYVLYDVFGFGPEAYVPAQCAGYLELHNLIYDGLRYQEEHRAGEIAAEVAALDEVVRGDDPV